MSMAMPPFGIESKALDDARREWEFEQLEREHASCCVGAILLEGRWVNVICPVDSPSYRSFRHEEDLLRERRERRS